MRHVSYLICLLILLPACGLVEEVDELQAPEWRPRFAAPLIRAEVSLRDVLDEFDTEAVLQTRSDGLLTYVYEGNAFVGRADDFLVLPTVGGPMPDTAFALPFLLDEVEVLEVKTGTLSYEVDIAQAGSLQVVLRIDNAFKNGQAFRKTLEVVGPRRLSGSFDLSGYTFEFVKPTLNVAYEAYLEGSPARQYLPGLRLTLHQLTHAYAQGELGGYEFSLAPDTLLVDLFEALGEADLSLEQLSLKFLIQNSFGIPIEVSTPGIEVTTRKQGYLLVEHAGLAEGFAMAYPSLQEVGEYRTSTLVMDETNSNLAAVVSAQPEEIRYDLRARAYPAGSEGVKGFITDESEFRIDVQAELPFFGSLSQLSLNDTLDMDWDLEAGVESAELKLMTENGFPLEAVLQVYFLDAQNRALDSLFASRRSLLAGAEVNANSEVVAAAEQTQSIELTRAQWEALENCARLHVQAYLSTSGQGQEAVKLYETYSLNARIGVIINQ